MSSVRHLLIAAVVLFAGSAQAVDYSQCEAMQKAAARLRNSRDIEADRAWKLSIAETPPKKFSFTEASAQCKEEIADPEDD